MKQIGIILLLLITLFSACSQIPSNSSSSLFSEPATLEKIKNKKKIIDTLSYNTNEQNKLIFYKLSGENEPKESEEWAQNIEKVFHILKDSLGQIKSITEFASSKGADWQIFLTHYFDEDGKTFAFEKKIILYDCILSQGNATETTITFYNNAFQLIGKDFTLVDQNNKSLSTERCKFQDYEYKISENVNEFLKINRIKTASTIK